MSLADADRALRDANYRLGEAPDDNTSAAVVHLVRAVESIQEVVKVLALGRQEAANTSAEARVKVLEKENARLCAHIINILPPVDGDSMGAPSYRYLAEENARLRAELARR